MNREKLVVIGNGMAGMHTVENILARDPDRFEIHVYGREPYANYNRIMLSSLLQGTSEEQDIIIHEEAWYEKHHIHFHKQEEVVRLDPANRLLYTAEGAEDSFDKAVFATGSDPFILPLPGTDFPSVIPFRTIDDCRYMIRRAASAKEAVVIGGGLLGLEAARGLLHQGMNVHVVHLAESVMERQLDQLAASLLQEELEQLGITFHMQCETASFTGTDDVEAVHFKDGRSIAADLVVMAVGIRPNTAAAAASGVACQRGIVVNRELQTNAPGIYAVGECAEIDGVTYGLVKPAYEQAEVLAANLCGETSSYADSILYTQLKAAGIDVFSAGRIEAGPADQVLIHRDDTMGVYRKLILNRDRLEGAVLYGDKAGQQEVLTLIRSRKLMLPDEARSILAAESGAGAASMKAADTVCHCNSVSCGDITAAFCRSGADTVQAVKAHTGAASSCGGCRPLVAELVTLLNSGTLQDDLPSDAFCSCTNLHTDAVAAEVMTMEAATPETVRKTLAFSNRNGCSYCRGALPYMLHLFKPEAGLIIETPYPAPASQDTVSFMPELPGGLVTPAQLKQFEQALEQFPHVSIQLTSEQRMLFTGIRQQEADTFKRCIGLAAEPTDYYRIRPVVTNGASGNHLSRELDQQLGRVPTPADIVVEISDRSLSASAQLSLTRSDAGWDIYLGSADKQLFYTAHADVFSFICALVQYYRESAFYEEPIDSWASRIGFVPVREVLLDEENCRLLHARLQEAQQHMERSTV
ncbi:nitrite reductase large subunit NirB [Bacillus daqingensis]|uniref:Nitrite reductase large subunit NirB n=1 Tax=Bacillus daqingensis TaxID=872396 RepID=A0ABV9NUV8_9BACI